MRALIVRAIRLMVAVFYRRVETVGLENVPREGAVLLVANHFNSLVDPMLVLATLDRPVVFVAKSTLWKVPVLRTLMDALGVVPIVRKVDVEKEGERGGDDRNEASFERLAAVLRGGGAVLIFPEGRSHSEPALSAIRTGAARVLLRAGVPVTVVPVGMWFVRKEVFRSDVLMTYGAPLRPARPDVDGWTRAVKDGLEEVTLNAGTWEDHEVVAAVEALWGEHAAAGGERLDRAFRARHVLLSAWRALEPLEPGAVESLALGARRFVKLLRRLGLSPRALDAPIAPWRILLVVLREVTLLAVGLPVAALGTLVFGIPYRLTDPIARRVYRGPERLDQLALGKILVGMVLHLSFLAAAAFLAWRAAGPWAAAAVAALVPFAGVFAAWWFERFEGDGRRLKALTLLLVSRDRLRRLVDERDALRAECDRLAARLKGAATGDNRGPWPT